MLLELSRSVVATSPCLFVFSPQVWVVNKTGVSLAYRANIKAKEDDDKKKVFVRRPQTACYRTDGDTMLFSRCASCSDGREVVYCGVEACSTVGIIGPVVFAACSVSQTLGEIFTLHERCSGLMPRMRMKKLRLTEPSFAASID